MLKYSIKQRIHQIQVPYITVEFEVQNSTHFRVKNNLLNKIYRHCFPFKKTFAPKRGRVVKIGTFMLVFQAKYKRWIIMPKSINLVKHLVNFCYPFANNLIFKLPMKAHIT